jgi:hypothetical protein
MPRITAKNSDFSITPVKYKQSKTSKNKILQYKTMLFKIPLLPLLFKKLRHYLNKKGESVSI